MAESLSPQALASVDDVKAYRSIPLTDTTKDDLFTRLLNAVSSTFADVAGREFVSNDATRTGGALDPIPDVARDFDGADLYCDELGRRELEIGDAHAIASVELEHLDGTIELVDAPDVTELPLRPRVGHPIEGLRFPRSLSIPRSSIVRVTAKWGWETVPEGARQAVIRQVVKWDATDTSLRGEVYGEAEGTPEELTIGRELERDVFDAAIRFRRFTLI